MKKSYTEKNSDNYRKELRDTSSTVARHFLFTEGYSSSSFEVPEYYITSGFDQMKLRPIAWGKGVPLITKPLNFLTPKGFLGWRNFSLIHPYIFVHIVNELTAQNNWELVKELLTQKTLVNCYSTPSFDILDESPRSVAVSRWLQMAENDLIKDGVNFTFLTVTDIENFYPSIYTHSIAWAIHGKAKAKESRWDYSLLGNKLDKLFQNARDGQTNGIPIGSMVSDIIAELILKSIDVELSKWIKDNDLKDSLLISRYRDDFRILSETEEQGRLTLKALSKIINREFNLTLNSKKTHIHNDILEGTLRDWTNEINEDFLLRQVKYRELPTEIKGDFLKEILIKIYRIQKKYSDGRSSVTLLSSLVKHLAADGVNVQINVSDIQTVVSILRKLSLVREEVSAQVYILLDILFSRITPTTQENIIKELIDIIEDENDYDYQVIWLYRLCLAHKPEKCKEILNESKSALIRLLTPLFRSKFDYDYEIFEKIEGLTESDKKQLYKFSYINDAILEDSVNLRINTDFMKFFKY